MFPFCGVKTIQKQFVQTIFIRNLLAPVLLLPDIFQPCTVQSVITNTSRQPTPPYNVPLNNEHQTLISAVPLNMEVPLQHTHCSIHTYCKAYLHESYANVAYLHESCAN